ncbi:MAG: sodium:calcium antiporter [Patescibacteria group bacterium]
MIFVWILILLVCLYFLTKAADYFTDAAEKIGIIFKLPTFVIGLLVVTFGTTAPELVTSIFSILDNEPGIVAGNIAGTIVANIFLGLGLAVVISRKTARFHWDNVSNDMPFLLGSLVLLALTIYDGQFSFFEAIIFLVSYSVYVFYALHIRKISPKEIRLDLNKEIRSRFHKNLKANKTNKISAQQAVRLVITFISSLAVIILSAKYAVETLIISAHILNIATPALAASIIAIGTSLPEISVAVSSARKGHFDLVLGNIMGACIFDTLVIFGVIGLFTTIFIPEIVINFILPVAIAAVLIQWLVTLDKKITVTEGLLMLILYFTFIIKLYKIF